MSFGSIAPWLSLALVAVMVVGVVVRLVLAARNGRTRSELRTIGGAITGAGAAQSSAFGWSPTSLEPQEGPVVSDDHDPTTTDGNDERR